MDGPLLVMKRWASVMWPRKNTYFSFHWVCSWSLLSCYESAWTSLRGSLPDLKLLTPAQAANAVALQNAMLWFSAAGAGPALLAGCLWGRSRVRRTLAGVGLASAVANHCVFTWILGVTILTAPSDELLAQSVTSAVIFVFYAVADANASRFLLRPPIGEEEE